jgi:ATP-dependent exoDNAse (exonuclease V) alpha subunit
VEGAAGAGKTSALRATHDLLARRGHRLVVVTPTLKAAEVVAAETGADGHSAAWLIHQHGWRWDTDGHWARRPDTDPNTGPNTGPAPEARLRPGDLLLVDEAGMLDQDTARALFTIADETGARVALVGDRHQLPAVGRGGVLDHAIAWAHPTAVVSLETVHRFTDPDYATLTLRMRTGENPAAVFDALHRRGQVVIHPGEAERTAALAGAGATGDLVVADTREQVAHLNAAIRDQRRAAPGTAASMTTAGGEQIGLGDRVATRRNDPDLGVANRQTWTVTAIGDHGDLTLRPQGRSQGRGQGRGRRRERAVPAEYVQRFVELAYATTVHGAQGETVDRAHVALGEATGAAAAYVAMTRGRADNTAHLVADTVEDARQQWVETFARDGADLGPAHARRQALEAVDRYGPQQRRRPGSPEFEEPRRPVPAPAGGISL